MESIIQTEKRCYVCGTTYNIHTHHCIHGTANRKLADKYGLTVYLCAEHHTGSAGVHHNQKLDAHLKKLAQERFEAEFGGDLDFVKVFGRNYI